jgi:hypothetical protein
MAVLEQSWIKVQEKTFGKWCVLPCDRDMCGSIVESTAYN